MGYWGDPFTQPKRYRTNVEIHLLLERKAIDHLSKQSKAPSAVASSYILRYNLLHEPLFVQSGDRRDKRPGTI
jgi:hypothetical protein